jgi:hypothetical protein
MGTLGAVVYLCAIEGHEGEVQHLAQGFGQANVIDRAGNPVWIWGEAR